LFSTCVRHQPDVKLRAKPSVLGSTAHSTKKSGT
jgi:hypothetical protein